MFGSGSNLQLGDHAGLGVVAGAVLVDQTFGQHLGVELLENVFVLDVLEHDHLWRRGPSNQRLRLIGGRAGGGNLPLG